MNPIRIAKPTPAGHLTVGDLADRWAVPATRVRSWIRRGLLAVTREGGEADTRTTRRLLVSAAAVRAFEREHGLAAAS